MGLKNNKLKDIRNVIKDNILNVKIENNFMVKSQIK